VCSKVYIVGLAFLSVHLLAWDENSFPRGVTVFRYKPLDEPSADPRVRDSTITLNFKDLWNGII